MKRRAFFFSLSKTVHFLNKNPYSVKKAWRTAYFHFYFSYSHVNIRIQLHETFFARTGHRGFPFAEEH